jgi:hypothetical protein
MVLTLAGSDIGKTSQGNTTTWAEVVAVIIQRAVRKDGPIPPTNFTHEFLR